MNIEFPKETPEQQLAVIDALVALNLKNLLAGYHAKPEDDPRPWFAVEVRDKLERIITYLNKKIPIMIDENGRKRESEKILKLQGILGTLHEETPLVSKATWEEIRSAFS